MTACAVTGPSLDPMGPLEPALRGGGHLLRAHRDRGFAAQHAVAVGEGHEDAVDAGQVRHARATGHEDAEGRRRVRLNVCRRARRRRRQAGSACRVGLADRQGHRQVGGVAVAHAGAFVENIGRRA
jgi:hypothetical protein